MKLLQITSIFLICAHFASAQSENDPIKYRIVAVSAADTAVTSISNELDLYLPLRIYMPTAFSPNGDGLNDTFGPVGEGIEQMKLIIYNRWGEVVFSSQDVASKWDGLHQGKPVPFGSYNYELLASGKEFGKIQKVGSVTVIN